MTQDSCWESGKVQVHGGVLCCVHTTVLQSRKLPVPGTTVLETLTQGPRPLV
jgi:hypothetical protein